MWKLESSKLLRHCHTSQPANHQVPFILSPKKLLTLSPVSYVLTSSWHAPLHRSPLPPWPHVPSGPFQRLMSLLEGTSQLSVGLLISAQVVVWGPLGSSPSKGSMLSGESAWGFALCSFPKPKPIRSAMCYISTYDEWFPGTPNTVLEFLSP